MSEPADFGTLAFGAILQLANTNDEFTADDVAAAMSLVTIPGDIRPFFVRAEKMKVIERTEEFRRSSRRRQHGRHLRVWRSLITPAAEIRKWSKYRHQQSLFGYEVRCSNGTDEVTVCGGMDAATAEWLVKQLQGRTFDGAQERRGM